MDKIKVGYPVDIEFKDKISSPFGMREHPTLKTRKMHWGVDYAIPEGSNIYTILSGQCVVSRDDGDNGFGKWCLIHSVLPDFKYTNLFCFYAHLQESLVNEGDSVIRGQQIGISGNTGRSSGPHLHFQICKDTASKFDYRENAIDPMEILNLVELEKHMESKSECLARHQSQGLIPYGTILGDNVTYDVLFDLLNSRQIKG